MLNEKSRHKVHTANFHSYKVPELAKIIYDGRYQNGGFSVDREDGDWKRNGGSL